MTKFCRYKIEEQLFPTETYPHENLSLSLEAKLFQDLLSGFLPSPHLFAAGVLFHVLTHHLCAIISTRLL